jgi:glucokinase
MSAENTSRNEYWVGFDLGGTKMMATVFDRGFEVLSRVRKKTKAHEGADSGVERIISLVEQSLDQAGIGREDVSGIGVGTPGPLDLDKGVLIDLPNLGWSNVPLKEKMERAFGCPVVVSNDVDAGTYGEYRFGAAKGARCVVGVFPGTGIGAGCVYEDNILRGKTRSCLEIGHCQMLSDGPLCGCGRHGCLETVASRLSLAAAAAAAAHRGQAPHLFEAAGMDLSNIKSGALAASIEAGDAAVETIVRNGARWLGIAVANVVNLLLPDIVVLGGGMVEAMPDLFRKEVEEAARERVMPAFESAFEVAVAELGDDATVLGAAAWAEHGLAAGPPGGGK